MSRTQSFAWIVAAATAAATAAETSATAAAADAAEAAYWAQVASVTSYGFETLAELEAFTTAGDHESATVWGDTEANNGIYHWDDGGSVWVRDADNIQQIVSDLSTFLALQPTGDDAAITFVNEAGYGLGRLSSDGIEEPTTATLVDDMATVIDLPDGFGVWPTGGDPVIVNEAGYATGIVGGDGAASSSSDTLTPARVSAVLGSDVEPEPLLVGDNVLFAWGESKAQGINQQETAFDDIVTDQGASVPAGAAVVAGVDAHPGHDIAELIDTTDLASLRAAIDSSFSGGAECVSTVALICQCNDMIAATNPDTWEAAILEAADLVQHYSMQKYLATDPDAPMPVPPIGLIIDCTYGKVGGRNIPLRAIDMASRYLNIDAIVPDYICSMAASQGDVSADSSGVHWTQSDIALICDYIGLWSYYRRVLNRKYEPTQVIDGWTQGNDFYLRCKMPHPPLVADTALVASIANNGLTGVDSSAAAVTLSSLSIVGGTIIKGTSSASLAGGGRIRGAWEPTTAGRSGKNDGARTMYRDSSPYVGSTTGPLYSPLLPFEFIFP